MSFLRAEWRKLAIANYEIDRAVLEKYVPTGTELDLWQGACYVSLIGFRFIKTRLLGVPIPFHTDFEEVNLRFYVRYKEGNKWKRGVVFIKEIVPKMALTFVANTLYNEPYATMPMKHFWGAKNGNLQVEYQWRCKGNWQKMSVETSAKTSAIEVGSEAEFITEHYWGYSKINPQTTYEYEVTHPRWLQYEVKNYDINVDFGLVYGEKFAFLNQATPKSVMLAEGSEITVENKKVLKFEMNEIKKKLVV